MPEPEMWPIGKAFACFVNAWVFKPDRKRYKHHGRTMICTKIGKMKPFECRRFDLKQKWEVIFDESFYSGAWWYYYWVSADYPPDPDILDECPRGWRDGHVRHYFFEAESFRPEPGSFMQIKWNDGLNCRADGMEAYCNYMYKAKYEKIWYYCKTLVWFYKPEFGSRLKVWRSMTGKFPGYYPVPEAEIIK